MDSFDTRGHSAPAARHRRAGITMMGVGVGLMFLIGLASDKPASAIRVGGFFVALGLAFVINGLFEARMSPPAPSSSHSQSTEPPITPPSGS
jgi:uncharacterized protein YjeT (DUF2065 family)